MNKLVFISRSVLVGVCAYLWIYQYTCRLCCVSCVAYLGCTVFYIYIYIYIYTCNYTYYIIVYTSSKSLKYAQINFEPLSHFDH